MPKRELTSHAFSAHTAATDPGSGMATLEDVAQALALLRGGMVKAVIAETVKFSEAAKAHALIEARSVTGRVVMQGW